MEVTEFNECNVVYGKNQPEYTPLPAYKSEETGIVVSCWKMTWKERLTVLVTGRVYLQLLTFGKPIQPQIISVNNPVRDIL